MKFNLFIATFFLTISTACIAHSAQRIKIIEPEFNFGTITQGQNVEHSFIIKNVGDQPLSIKSVKPACGCTAAKVSSSLIQPGKSSKIKITFKSTNFAGTIRKTIDVLTDDPKVRVTTLSFTGSIIEEIIINPRQLNLGIINGGSAKKITVSITNNSKKALMLSISSPYPQFSVTPNKYVLKPGESEKISVSATPLSGDRMLSGYISIKTDHPAKNEIIIPIFASVKN